MIAILDYGVGNLRSVEKAFSAAGAPALVSDDHRVLCEAAGLVLPGVGAFAACMTGLKSRGFDELIRDRVSQGTPLLGVCVGMQMLFEASEEFGPTPGLGLIAGRVRRFASTELVPQVGWNQVHKSAEHYLLDGVDDQAFFYFVHSYYCDPVDRSAVVGETRYGLNYASVVASNHIAGVQFHPEKSQSVGLRLLANFSRIVERRERKC